MCCATVMVIYSSNILKWLICLFKDSFTIYFCINIHFALLLPSCHWKIDPSPLRLERPGTDPSRDGAGATGPGCPSAPWGGVQGSRGLLRMKVCTQKELRNKKYKGRTRDLGRHFKRNTIRRQTHLGRTARCMVCKARGSHQALAGISVSITE